MNEGHEMATDRVGGADPGDEVQRIGLGEGVQGGPKPVSAQPQSVTIYHLQPKPGRISFRVAESGWYTITISRGLPQPLHTT